MKRNPSFFYILFSTFLLTACCTTKSGKNTTTNEPNNQNPAIEQTDIPITIASNDFIKNIKSTDDKNLEGNIIFLCATYRLPPPTNQKEFADWLLKVSNDVGLFFIEKVMNVHKKLYATPIPEVSATHLIALHDSYIILAAIAQQEQYMIGLRIAVEAEYNPTLDKNLLLLHTLVIKAHQFTRTFMVEYDAIFFSGTQNPAHQQDDNKEKWIKL